MALLPCPKNNDSDFLPHSHITSIIHLWCLSQDLETGCLKLAVVKYLGVQIFKGDHNILIFQP